jgi:transposase-like protein
MLRVVTDGSTREEPASMLDEICRQGAQRMLAAALEAEADNYIAELLGELDERGRRLVTRNGHAGPRTITTGSGPIRIEAPRVNDRRVDADTGEKARFRSSIVPPWCRKSPKVAEVLPLLYLHGLSTGDFTPALTEFFGSSAGLSPSVVTRLTTQWQAEHRAFMDRDLSDRDYVYCWVDGVHFNVRLEQDRLCCLVIVGVRLDGTKELVALADGYRESTDSWADLLRDLKRRGMRAPVVAVGDGALGFWAALRDVWPKTCEQRDWVHKVANVLDALPTSVQPTAKKMLAEIRDAEDRDHAVVAAKRLDAEFRPKWPRAADKVASDLDRLLTFFDFPAERWLHQDVEPDRVDLLHRPVAYQGHQGPGLESGRVAMAFKLIEPAQHRWRAVNAPHLVALVRAGARFENGQLVERPDESGGDAQAA